MKKVIILLFLVSSLISYSQGYNGFKYIYVAPINYTDGSSDYWGIEAQTKKFFKNIGFKIINNINEVSEIENICEVLNIQITHTNCKVNCYNTVTLKLSDCNGKWSTIKDSAMSLSLRGDYRNATKKVLKTISSRFIKNYHFDSYYTPKYKTNVVQNQDLNFDEKSLREYLSNKKLDPFEGIWEYTSSDKTSLSEYKLLVLKEDFKYVLYIIEGTGLWKKSDKKAEFETAASNEVITMKWTMGDKRTKIKTIGVVKNYSIIEFDINDSKTILYKTFPKFKSNKKNIRNGEWIGNGSGIIISKSGHIVTNNHVIDDTKKIEIEFNYNGENVKYNAEVIQTDAVNDLAILKIFDINFDGLDDLPYYFKTRSSDVGTKVYAFGYPMALSAMGKEIKITDGIISSKSGFDGDVTTYQITAPIQGGNSGGPLFDDKGNLLGINSSKLRSDIADNVGYTIKSSYILNLIDVLPKSIDLPSSTKLQTLSLTEQIKEISKYVVLIKVK